MRKVNKTLAFAAFSAVAAFGVAEACKAQAAPIDIKASPDIYKEVAGNDQYRVVEGVFKPGQRDNFHSHPRMLFYWATDCSMRWYLPDGSTQDIEVKAGRAGVQDTVVHSVENRGASECRVVMFEPRAVD